MNIPKVANRAKDVLAFCAFAVLLTSCLVVAAEYLARYIYLGELARETKASKSMVAYSYYDWTEEHFDSLARTKGAIRWTYEPYYLWRMSEFRSSTYNFGENGFRITKNPVKKDPERNVTVFMMGGSTTVCSQVPDDWTIASVLSSRLNERSRTDQYEVHNYASVGYVFDQEVVLLCRLLEGGKVPDIVVFYDGVNDTVNKVCRGVPHYSFKRFKHLEGPQLSINTTLLNYFAERSYVLRLITGNPKPHEFTADRNRIRRSADEMVREYLQGIAFVRKLSQAYGFSCVFLWQPNLFNTGKLLSQEERSFLGRKQENTLRVGYTEAQERIRNLSEPGFHDISDAFDGIEKSIFVDYCHVAAIGNLAIAERIERILVEDGYL